MRVGAGDRCFWSGFPDSAFGGRSPIGRLYERARAVSPGHHARRGWRRRDQDAPYAQKRLPTSRLTQWRGLRWTDTVPPEAAEQVAKAVESAGREGRILLLHRHSAAAERPRAHARVYDGQARQESRLRRDRQERSGHFRPEVAPGASSRRSASRTTGSFARSRPATARCSTPRPKPSRSCGSTICGLSKPTRRRRSRWVSSPGAISFADLTDRDRKSLDALLETARMRGRAPSIVLHLPDSRLVEPARLDAERARQGPSTSSRWRRSPKPDRPASASDREEASFSLETFICRLPEASPSSIATASSNSPTRPSSISFRRAWRARSSARTRRSGSPAPAPDCA